MWRQFYQPLKTRLTARGAPGLLKTTFHRQFSFGFPKEYKQTVSKNFRNPLHVLRHHWELTPLLACLVVDAYLMCGAVYNSFKNRVDIQLTQHNWNCISRNMDLRNPTVHKLLVFNQQYEPWLEMQNVLDKIAQKEAKPCALQKGKINNSKLNSV